MTGGDREFPGLCLKLTSKMGHASRHWGRLHNTYTLTSFLWRNNIASITTLVIDGISLCRLLTFASSATFISKIHKCCIDGKNATGTAYIFVGTKVDFLDLGVQKIESSRKNRFFRTFDIN